IAADADGFVYVGSGQGLLKIGFEGEILKSNDKIAATDLDLSTDGKLLASGGGNVRVVNITDLSVESAFTTGTFLGSTFASWSTSQIPGVEAVDVTPPEANATLVDPIDPNAEAYEVTVTYTDDSGSMDE